MEQKLKLIGIISLVLGITATALCFLSFGIMYALLAGTIGMLISGVYVGIDTKYEINKNKITIGIISMFLSSVPILFLLAVIILSKINS